MNNIKELEKLIDYKFKDENLLLEALIHSSYANENKNVKFNERLEFLGDSVLSLVITSFLFRNLPKEKEGVLSKTRATIVCEKSLRDASENFNLKKFLLIGKGEETSGGREKDSIIADAFEALIGAIYIDSGLKEAEKFIFKYMKDIVSLGLKGELFSDYKTKLQELLQKNKVLNIKYIVINEQGPSHNKLFTVALFVNERKVSVGVGKSKKEAEQMAAKEALLEKF